MTVDEIVKAFKSAFVRINTDLIMVALIAEVPFFGLPIISNITRLIVSQILQYGVNKGELGVYFLYVNSYTKDQANKFELAAINNKIAQEGDNDAFKKQAEDELIECARKLIKFGG